MRKKQLYPCVQEAEEERARASRNHCPVDEEPDWTPSGKPNYEKFEKFGWDTEKVLVWLNID